MKKLLLFALTTLAVLNAMASPLVLEDFESYAIGTTVKLWNFWGGDPAGSAKVVADPANANNKVLYVKISGWGNFVQVALPENLHGAGLINEKDYVTFRIRRASADANDYKKIQIYQDKSLLFEDESYPHQGDKDVWQSRSYTLPTTAAGLDYGTNGGKVLALGFNSDASEYYIDDIAVKGEYDDYETIEGKVTRSFTKQNTSSTYETFSTPIRMLPGSNLILETARYTYITSPVIGEGRIDIYSGGERTYLGGSNKYTPDWLNFKGDVHVYPYKKLSSSNTFYGLVWMHNGKTFSTSTAAVDIAETNPVSNFLKSKLTLHDGATMASESGTRAIRIGTLATEAGSQIYGYMKTSAGNHAYYIVGFSGDDSELAGTISPYGGMTSNRVGLYKEGLGTYRITGNRNNITGGVTVLRGRVLVNNDAEAAKSQKLLGGVGNIDGLQVRKDGIAGGTGNVGATSNIYGILQPGDDGIGTITFANYASSAKPTLTMRPTGRIDCEICTKDSYDKVVVDGAVAYNSLDQDYAESTQMPRLRIQLTSDAYLQEGDSFTLLEAKSKTATDGKAWEFDIIYPKAYTWKVEQIASADGFKVIATVTSVGYSGQGDVEDVDDGPATSTDDGILEIEKEMADAEHSLRSFVDDRECYVGTCVPVWSIDVDNDKESRSALIAKEYNMVVCENEMKFDATEPSQGSFSYYHGDRLVNFAKRHGMYVRGHALAWHSQVPSWLTDDGKKNTKNWTRKQLLDILHNHIKNVVTHWKGKIQEWDVANEVLSDDQQSITNNPKAYDLRPSVWATGIGEDFLDSAFVWAHKYDPDAKLILNDYGVEGKGWGKSEALYNLAMRLKNSGIPIDGVGLQSHMDAGLGYTSSIEDNIKRFGNAGMLCHITELDLGINDNTEASLNAQAESYYKLARIAMRHDNCKSLMIWGLSDDLTWRTGRRPLLYDSNLKAKPAYWAVHAALRQASGKELTSIDEIEQTVDGKSYTIIHNLQGQRVNVMSKGLYIINGKKVLNH